MGNEIQKCFRFRRQLKLAGGNPTPRSDHDTRTSIEHSKSMTTRGRKQAMAVVTCPVSAKRRQLRWRDTRGCAPSEGAAEPLPLLSAPPNLDDGLETPGSFAHPRRQNDSPEHTQGAILGKRSVPLSSKSILRTRLGLTLLPHVQSSFAAEQTGKIPYGVDFSVGHPLFIDLSVCP